MLTKRYRLINDLGGWLVFAIALVTYWLTLEPTASYWDCGEFIIQADKLEVGHPPGNPIFMLTARFFANFASDAASISVMVNAMSGLLSALTILLLFWTITHLVRRLVVKDSQRKEPSLQQYLAIMGSGLVGSLAYCWSDTFWFSAVEGEVYAFSSFCTALVFWLALKWENRADQPHSDRYLILIAYIIGVSVAVHLLNLLCIPAIVLVYAYRRNKDMDVVKSLVALLISFAIIFFVLFGLVPGFIKAAQVSELLFVNGFGLGFNSGAIIYALVAAGVFIWTLYELRRQRSGLWIRVSVLLSVTLSGMLFVGSGWVIGAVLTAGLIALLWLGWKRNLPVRGLTVAMWSIAVIFVGYSSYALILIRSTADTPMNQNSPDNVFALASYLNREQYGENPLLYGETLNSSPMKEQVGVRRDTVQYDEEGRPLVLVSPSYRSVVEPGKALYVKGVAGATPTSEYGFLSEGDIRRNQELAERGRDYYVKQDHKAEAKMNPELNMLFPRIYSKMHRDQYGVWVNLDTMPENTVEIQARDASTGDMVPEVDFNREPQYNPYSGTWNYPAKTAYKPSFAQNLAYFFNYQLNHMYLRYFMWNFAGRQNDINNQFGELDAGNWISGIPAIDNTRLGDQSLLPDDLGKGNKGHNVYYMLPLILGIVGLLWQAFAGKRGIEQFWVVFFLFFMTGIAIVIYLNQPPNQPRERDYAFAGSFYAFAIWIGMGVAGLWRLLLMLLAPKGSLNAAMKADEGDQAETVVEEPASWGKASRYSALIACLLGICVPAQMVSQTWDDHDRSHRFAARDFAVNYLESLEPNAIVFCNGDNDTFPLWYAQEVEGVRPDVRIVNLSYLNSDWYANQLLLPAYDSAPVKLTAEPKDYAYGRSDVVIIPPGARGSMNMLDAIKGVYAGKGRDLYGYPVIDAATVYVPVDKEAVVKAGLVSPRDTARLVDRIEIDLAGTQTYRRKGYVSLGELLMLDILATNAAEGWPRPIYWVTTVGHENHVGLTPYLRSTGMAHQIVPTMQEDMATRTDKAYDVVTKKYRWGGADLGADGNGPYYDETARRMLTTVRTSMTDLATELLYEGDDMRQGGRADAAQPEYRKALEVLDLMLSKLPEGQQPLSLSLGMTTAQLYCELGQSDRLNDKKLTEKGLKLYEGMMKRYLPYVTYHREMAATFGNPSFTLETQYVPYQWYQFARMYMDYGGSPKEVEKILAGSGVTLDELKQNWDRLNGRSDSQGSQALSVGDFLDEMEKYAQIVNKLAALSPEEYAKQSAEEREVDSMYYELVTYYLSQGGSQEELDKRAACKAVDMGRSKRLSDSYSGS